MQSSLAGPRLRVLLAALLLQANTPVSAHALAEAVWGGQLPPAAIQTLRSYVRRLRQALGPQAGALIQARDPGYLIRLEDAELDVLEFGTLCREAAAALPTGAWSRASDAAGRALELWRGAPLLDVPSQLLHEEIVPRLEQLRVQAIEDRAEAELHLGRQEQLVPELRDLTVQHPLRERFHAQLMLALCRCGRQAEALECYRGARRVLVQELGIEPGPELRRLHERVLAGDVSLLVSGQGERVPESDRAGAPVPRQLPAPVLYFTGRAAQLKELDELLDQTEVETAGTVVISAIGGTTGVGKTTLAVHWARQVANRFPDGQIYVNLRGFTPSGTPAEPTEAIRGCLDALGVPAERIPSDLAAQTGLYRSVLAGRKILVMLDNARDEEQVRPLLPHAPGCLTLITSRNQLTGLAAAEGARLLTLDVLSHAEACQMLTARLGCDRADAEPEALGEIAELCARLPLALAVAAARMAAKPRFPLTGLAAELRASRGRLEALDTGDPAVTVRGALSWSYRGLSGPAQRIFRLLAVHLGPDISVAAAASLAGAELTLVRHHLAELTRAHLLNEHRPGRYAFHDLLRAYAAEQAAALDDGPNRKAAIGRVLDHYLHTACAADRLLVPSRDVPVTLAPPPRASPEHLMDREQAHAWFAADHHGLLAAVTLADHNGFDVHAWQLPWAMGMFLDMQGHSREQSAIQNIAIAAAERLGDTAAQAVSHLLQGRAFTRSCDYGPAHACYSRALRLYEQLGDRAREARAYEGLGAVAQHQEQHAAAVEHARQALRLYQEAGHQAGQAMALNNVGFCLALLGDYRQASTFCRQALILYQQLGQDYGQAAAWDSIGYIENRLGCQADAISCYQQSLGLIREIGDRRGEAEILTHFGDAHQAAGSVDEARAAWQQALDILSSLRHPDVGKVRHRLSLLPLPVRRTSALYS
jgi:DNA-binding SARP family transcriptional activator